ncbi:MAG: methionyl-tRNA formyltransferase [Candidatus Levybacteria bacterium]|nr:methionyl-tRNA formyltransferase [Candidatus Levybacteria bacterium]
MKKVVFFGSGYFVIPVIKALQDQGLVLVVTNEPKGRLVDYLKKHKIPYIYSQLKDSLAIDKIKEIEPDLAVLASFGVYIPDAIINMFPLGILNVHPSLLPEFKGPSPVQFTILSGILKTGVTIIQMDDEFDHGPIVAQESVDLTGNETSPELLESLFEVGAKLIKNIVQDVNSGLQIQSTPQDHKNETWSIEIEKKDGKIDLKNPPEKVELLRKIRAYHPWPGVHLNASLNGKNKILKVMPYDTVQVEGKNPMSYKDFLNGYGHDAESILNQLKLL